MAASFICDGCGTSVTAPKRVGHALVRDYCEECEKRAQAFVEAEEALRSRLHEQFTNDRGLLIAAAAEGGFKLPDVPNGG